MTTIRGKLFVWMLVLVAAHAIPHPSAAQTKFLVAEAGQRSDDHMNGVSNTSYFGGIAASLVIGGGAGKQTAFVLPVAAEFRWSNKSYFDLNAFADAAARVGPLTAGAGFAFSFDGVPDIPDQIAGDSEGTVTVINPLSFGYSGSAKLTLGPQGRFFVQGRYVMLPADYSFPYQTAETNQVYIDNNIPREDVTQRDSHSMRFAVGYVFSRVALRVQVISETWRYDPVFTNTTGAYDRDARIISFGAVFH
jgi:hypothetical protein